MPGLEAAGVSSWCLTRTSGASTSHLMDSERLRGAQSTGRRFGIVLFAVVVSSFVVVCSAQILYQGFHDRTVATAGGCRAVVAKLALSVQVARESAGNVADERIALHRFRDALGPEWQARPQLDKICRSDPWAREAISAIDEWRWAEETAIRYESVDLAPSRRRVQAIEARLGSPR